MASMAPTTQNIAHLASKIDKNRRAAIAILTRDLDIKDTHQWRRWRIFFMACEKLLDSTEETNGT